MSGGRREAGHRSSGDLQHQAEHVRTRRPSVLNYLLILFAVAFLLLLMAYFQQQRANRETSSALQQSVSAVGTIQDMLEDNEQLRQQVDELRKEAEGLKAQIAELDTARRIQNNNLNLMTDQLAAMDYLWRIQRFYSRGAYSDAKALTDQFEATGLPASLPRTNPAGISGTTPMDQYNALLNAMGYRSEP